MDSPVPAGTRALQGRCAKKKEAARKPRSYFRLNGVRRTRLLEKRAQGPAERLFLFAALGGLGSNGVLPVRAAGRADAVGKGRFAAGLAVDDAGSGHAVVGTTVALAGMGFFVLLNGHDILLKKLYSLCAPG